VERFLAVRKPGAQKREGREGGEGGEGWFLKGVKLVKLNWVTKKAVARYMTRGATDAESGVKDCLKQRPMYRNLEL
jgi:hypothetical protein